MNVIVKLAQIEGDNAAEIAAVVNAALGNTVEEPKAIEASTEPTPAAAAEVVDADGEPLPSGPFDSWEDIPAEWRWINAPGDTVHIRRQPGLPVAMCPLSAKKIGMRRINDTEPPIRGAEVCERCVHHLEIEARNA